MILEIKKKKCNRSNFNFIFIIIIFFSPPGNVRCEGGNFLLQAENCHYRASAMCGPHALMIINRVNITNSTGNGANDFICRCGYRDGARTCIGEDIHNSSSVLPNPLSYGFLYLCIAWFTYMKHIDASP